ncbi:hypothetical protein HYW21_04340 [Candidatus Woesearchaeota archaeon]|nr:hypothetical protein [Candidatus Woesearchaeota archaeon]
MSKNDGMNNQSKPTLMYNKRGVLFTVITLFLFSTIFWLAKASLDRYKTLESDSIAFQGVSEMLYFEDDLVSNLYPDLLGTHVINLSREDTFRVSLQQYDLSPNINHTALLQNYTAFVQTSYAQLNNLNITLSGLTPAFTLLPFGAAYELNGGTLLLSHQNISPLNNITLALQVDTPYYVAVNSSPSSDGGVGFHVTITSPKGSYVTTPLLDPSIVHNPITVNFTNGAGIQIFFGPYNGQNGTVRIIATDLQANITQFDLDYDLPMEKVYILSGNMTLQRVGQNVSKHSSIIVAQE